MDGEFDGFLINNNPVPMRMTTNDSGKFTTTSRFQSGGYNKVSPERNRVNTKLDESLLRIMKTPVKINQVVPFNDNAATHQEIMTKSKLHLKYFNLFAGNQSTAELINQFIAEPYGLISSDTEGKTFALSDCLERMQEGCLIELVDYIRLGKQEVFVKLTQDSLVISHLLGKASHQKELKFRELKGIVIGKGASTFKQYVKYNKGYRTSRGDPNHFSVIGDVQTYDFTSRSETVRYDMCVTLSMLIHLHTQKLSSLPIGKSKLYEGEIIIFSFREKVRKEAAKRLLSVKELFMVRIIQLAIVKSLVLQQDFLRSRQVAELLESRFQQSERFYKFIKFIIEDVLKHANDAKNHHEFVRIKMLKKKQYFHLFPDVAHGFRDTGRSSSKFSAYFIPGMREVMKQAQLVSSFDDTRTRVQYFYTK